MSASPTAKPPASTNTSRKLLIPLLAELTPIGDGRFILKPQLADPHTWLAVSPAAKLLHLAAQNLYPLIRSEFLIHYKPLQRRYLVRLDSILKLKNATQDPEFWDDQSLQDRLRAWVRQETRKAIADAMQLSNSDS